MKKYVSLYTVIGAIGLAAVLIGFSKTFIIPVTNATFHAPPIIYIHGFFALSWIVLFLAQAYLIKVGNWTLHMTMGMLGLLIAVVIAVTIPMVGVYQVQKDLAAGLGDTAISTILGAFTSALLFFALVLVGLYYRNSPEVHKRLMLLATIVVLWPAWFRFRHFLPSVPNPEIWFALVLAYSLIIVAWIWDKLANGRIHPTLLYVGWFVIIEQSFEVVAFDTGPWRAIAKTLYALF